MPGMTTEPDATAHAPGLETRGSGSPSRDASRDSSIAAWGAAQHWQPRSVPPGGATKARARPHASELPVSEALGHLGTGPAQVQVVVLAGLVWAADAIAVMAASFLGPAATCQWGLSPAAEGALGSVVFGGMLAGAPLWGAWADALGRRPCMLASSALTAAACLAGAAAPNFLALAAARAVAGFGLAAAGPVAFTLLLEWLPPRARGTWLVAFNLWWTAGTVGAALVSWALLGSAGWRGLLAATAVPQLLLVACYRLLPESPQWLLASAAEAQAAAAAATQHGGGAGFSSGSKRSRARDVSQHHYQKLEGSEEAEGQEGDGCSVALLSTGCNPAAGPSSLRGLRPRSRSHSQTGEGVTGTAGAAVAVATDDEGVQEDAGMGIGTEAQPLLQTSPAAALGLQDREPQQHQRRGWWGRTAHALRGLLPPHALPLLHQRHSKTKAGGRGQLHGGRAMGGAAGAAASAQAAEADAWAHAASAHAAELLQWAAGQAGRRLPTGRLVPDQGAGAGDGDEEDGQGQQEQEEEEDGGSGDDASGGAEGGAGEAGPEAAEEGRVHWPHRRGHANVGGARGARDARRSGGGSADEWLLPSSRSSPAQSSDGRARGTAGQGQGTPGPGSPSASPLLSPSPSYRPPEAAAALEVAAASGSTSSGGGSLRSRSSSLASLSKAALLPLLSPKAAQCCSGPARPDRRTALHSMRKDSHQHARGQRRKRPATSSSKGRGGAPRAAWHALLRPAALPVLAALLITWFACAGSYYGVALLAAELAQQEGGGSGSGAPAQNVSSSSGGGGGPAGFPPQGFMSGSVTGLQQQAQGGWAAGPLDARANGTSQAEWGAPGRRMTGDHAADGGSGGGDAGTSEGSSQNEGGGSGGGSRGRCGSSGRLYLPGSAFLAVIVAAAAELPAVAYCWVLVAAGGPGQGQEEGAKEGREEGQGREGPQQAAGGKERGGGGAGGGKGRHGHHGARAWPVVVSLAGTALALGLDAAVRLWAVSAEPPSATSAPPPPPPPALPAGLPPPPGFLHSGSNMTAASEFSAGPGTHVEGVWAARADAWSLLAARTLATAAYSLLYLYTPQLIPAQVRSATMGVCVSVSRLGGLAAPILAVTLVESGHTLASLTSFAAVTGAAAAALALVAPRAGVLSGAKA